MPLSRDDRMTFTTSTILVDKTWMAIYRRISSRDVYIPSDSYLNRYIKTHPKSGEKHLCRFVTIYGDCFDDGKISNALGTLLDFHAPSLCTAPIQISMAIQHNCTWCLCDLPKVVIDIALELRHLERFGKLCNCPQNTHFHPIRRLTIKSDRADFISAIVFSLPHLVTLRIDGAIESPPPSVTLSDGEFELVLEENKIVTGKSWVGHLVEEKDGLRIFQRMADR